MSSIETSTETSTEVPVKILGSKTDILEQRQPPTSAENGTFSAYFDENSKQRRALHVPTNSRITGILPKRATIWTENNSVDKCFACSAPFTIMSRKHHCRGCGKIFCKNCSNMTILATRLEKNGLINYERYLHDLQKVKVKDEELRSYPVSAPSAPVFKEFKSCEACKVLFDRASSLSKELLELEKYTIPQIYEKSNESEILYEACQIFLSKFREIQYIIPYHKYTKFEAKALRNNIDLLAGHSKLVCNAIKSIDWSKLNADEIKFLLTKLTLGQAQAKGVPVKKTVSCWEFMCSSQCKESLDDFDIIDIIMHVGSSEVRKFVIKFLTKNEKKLYCLLPNLVYASQLETHTDDSSPFDELIELSQSNGTFTSEGSKREEPKVPPNKKSILIPPQIITTNYDRTSPLNSFIGELASIPSEQMKYGSNTHLSYNSDSLGVIGDYLLELIQVFPKLASTLYYEVKVLLEEDISPHSSLSHTGVFSETFVSEKTGEYYRKFLHRLKCTIETKLPAEYYSLKKNQEFIEAFADLKTKRKITDVQQLIKRRLSYHPEICTSGSGATTTVGVENARFRLSLNPDLILLQVLTEDIKIIDSMTAPIFVPCKVLTEPNSLNSLEFKKPNSSQTPIDRAFIFKTEDIRKDRIISSIIRLLDLILQENGLDLGIISYSVLPVNKSQGLIEIVPDSETIYNINNKLNYTIQNYICENNPMESIDTIRHRFANSAGAYCVITYLLGIGDRHLDNIMITKRGILFHIDYSFVLGSDPKLLAPQIRLTSDMIDALGGTQSKYYAQFESVCGQCYSILRNYSSLITNMLMLLTNIDSQNITANQIRTEMHKRFLTGEERSQAKLQFKKVIYNSRSSFNWIDIVHHYAKKVFY